MEPAPIWIVYFYNYKIHLDNSSSKHEKYNIVWSSTNIIQMNPLLIFMEVFERLYLYSQK